MKIWDFAYFLKIKTMGISPTLGVDTTTTPREGPQKLFSLIALDSVISKPNIESISGF